MNISRLTFATLSVLLAIALGGCSQPKPQTAPDVNAESSAPSAPSNVPASSQAAESSPASTKEAQNSSGGESKPAFQIQAKLTGFQQLDERTAFAWGLAGTELRVYRTDDGGGRWKDVTPDHKVTSGVEPGNNRSISFADTQHGWIVGEEDGKAEVLRTVDGGSTWKAAPFPDHAYPIGLIFPDAGRGRLLTSGDAGMGHSEKSFYNSSDGGATWKKVMENGGYIPTNNPTEHAIPQEGHANKGMTFRDSDNGWVPLESPDEKLHLFRTKDGGKTWSEVNLDLPKLNTDCRPAIAAAPVFTGPDRKRGWLPIECRETGRDRYHAFRTDDGGEHWTFVAFGPEASAEPGKGNAPVMTGLDEGWYWDGTQLLHTSDGGVKWIPLPGAVKLPDKLKQYPRLIELGFVSSKKGWMIVGSDDTQKSLLLQTTDGGISWKIL